MNIPKGIVVIYHPKGREGEEGKSRGCKGGSEEGSVVANKVKREN